jgi:TRAP-type C4-dicarboxylate transport system substrate-binding protein
MALGASPTPVAFGEAYLALRSQLGINIDQ